MQKSQNDISVSIIVPVYNVEEYLIECLDSLKNQTLQNYQVIMIDDGSTDKSPQMAEEYAKENPQFEYYRIENQGLGHARNYAMQFVRGKYFTFIDSDDVIEPSIYQRMVQAIEETGSQFAICNVARFNTKKVWVSTLHDKVFKQLGKTAHISENPTLINDTISCNKLISTEFWKKHDFKFPEGILYEDIPVTIPMHYLADKVAVVDKVGYYWRQRDGLSTSITQNTQNMKNLYDRIAIMKKLDKFFDENVKEDHLIFAKQKKYLEVDMMIFINNCNKISPEQALETMGIIREYIKENISPESIEKLGVIHKQKIMCVLENDLEGLTRVLDNQAQDYYSAPIVEKEGRFFIDCSDEIFRIPDRDVTEDLRNATPRTYVNDIKIKPTVIEVSAQLYIPRINIKDFSEQKIEAFLINEETSNTVPLDVLPEKNTQLTTNRGYIYNAFKNSGYQYNYDGTGFKIVLDVKKLGTNECSKGKNYILLKYENRVASGKIYLGKTSKQTAIKIADNAVISGDDVLRLGMDMFQEFTVTLTRETNFVKKIVFSKNQIEITTENPTEKLFVKDEEGAVVPFEKKRKTRFEASVSSFDMNKSYILYSSNERGEEQRILRRKKETTIQGMQNCAMILRSNKTLFCGFTKIPYCSQILRQQKKGTKIKVSLTSVGDCSVLADVMYASLVVDDEIAREVVTLAKSKCVVKKTMIMSNFEIDFSDEVITKNLYSSYRFVYVEYTMRDQSVVRHSLYAKRHFNHTISSGTLKVDFYRSPMCEVKIHPQYQWLEEENTGPKRQALREKYYPEFRQLPINPKCIVFESMWGSKYSCNPQHLYEYIDKYYPEYECVWSLNDPRTPILGNGKRVRRGSMEYYRYLATAKYFVNNVNFEETYEKRDGQIEIQTMHGTPLKTLGLDVKGDFPTEAIIQNYLRKNARWDYLLVQGSFMEEKAFSCYGFEKEILKMGYPRTDTLFKNHTPERIQALKEQLDIPLDKKVILYVPTWRYKNRFDMEMDIESMKKALSDEYVLLIRLHHFSAKGYDIPADRSFVYNLNNYHSVEDLYLLTDIMITDYSSVMFDYGVLKKPMIFFIYDIREYADQLRGMYFDIEKEAPGPIAYTSEELVEIIQNMRNEMDKATERIDAFNNKYVNYECENSCEKIFKKVFDTETDLGGEK